MSDISKKKLPDDVIGKINRAESEGDDSPLSKTIYDTMFQNQELAGKAGPSELPGYRRAAILAKCGTNFR
ncbi:MAG: hypothetical protein ACLUD0_09570 [Eubacterium ramulus]